MQAFYLHILRHILQTLKIPQYALVERILPKFIFPVNIIPNSFLHDNLVFH